MTQHKFGSKVSRRDALRLGAATLAAAGFAPRLLATTNALDDIIMGTIPATSNPAHLRENMAGGRGPLPDAAMRQRISALLD